MSSLDVRYHSAAHGREQRDDVRSQRHRWCGHRLHLRYMATLAADEASGADSRTAGHHRTADVGGCVSAVAVESSMGR